MEGKINPALPSPLESVEYQFNRWRETRKNTRAPIPEELWTEAARLRNQYPISQISKVLRLNHADLKNRISGQRLKGRRKKPGPRFIELNCLSPLPSSECVIEMEDALGSKMRMTFKGKADLDLLEMGKAFWSKGR